MIIVKKEQNYERAQMTWGSHILSSFPTGLWKLPFGEWFLPLNLIIEKHKNVIKTTLS
jgi:hypothetical protein